jgi:hypothetical protein
VLASHSAQLRNRNNVDPLLSLVERKALLFTTVALDNSVDCCRIIARQTDMTCNNHNEINKTHKG